VEGALAPDPGWPVMTPCVEQAGSRTRDGYVLARMPGTPRRGGAPKRRTSAHRAAWIKAYGPIPDGLVVCHSCDNPPCVNLDHLWLGTVADNNRDRAAKGRSARNISPHPGEANGRAILTVAQVEEIRDLHEREGRKLRARPRTGLTRAQIAGRFGVSPPTVDAILSGRNWKGGATIQSLGRSASSGQGLA
jgi:hypothetical protein